MDLNFFWKRVDFFPKKINWIYLKGDKFKKLFEDGESTEFSGKVVVALAQDTNIMKFTGKVVISSDYAQSHGILHFIFDKIILIFLMSIILMN